MQSQLFARHALLHSDHLVTFEVCLQSLLRALTSLQFVAGQFLLLLHSMAMKLRPFLLAHLKTQIGKCVRTPKF
jgi:hypothetical protein